LSAIPRLPNATRQERKNNYNNVTSEPTVMSRSLESLPFGVGIGDGPHVSYVRFVNNSDIEAYIIIL